VHHFDYGAGYGFGALTPGPPDGPTSRHSTSNGLTGLFRRRLIAVLAAKDRNGAAVIRLLSVVFRIGGSELLERAAREREPRDDGRAEGCGVARSFDQVARDAVGTCYRIC